MRIALIGTRGVPARYGGFETAIEEIGQRLVVMGHEVTVFCRGEDEQLDEYLGMKLVHLPAAKKRALETLSHTALSVIHPVLHGTDSAIVFNAANAPLLPILRARSIPVACHVDGLEWQRAKWGPLGRKYYRFAESLAVRLADALIADAPGIAEYYRREFGAETVQIAYGAPILTDIGTHRLAELGVTPGSYHLVVARAEPENHILEIVRGYVSSPATRPLVVVGSAPYADEYLAAISAAADDRVKLVGSLWDQELLDQLYANALTYLHGHCVGGTNPSLLRAAGAGAYPIAYDVSFNRDIIGVNGDYFTDESSVAAALIKAEADPARCHVYGVALQNAITAYNWDAVAAKYEQLCGRLATAGPTKTRPSGRRVGNAKAPKSILVANPGIELYGSDRVLLETVSGFLAAGVKVTAALPDSGPLADELAARGAEVVYCPIPVLRKSVLSPRGFLAYISGNIRALATMRKLISASRPDLLFINTITIPTWLIAAKLSGRPALVHVHEAEQTQSLIVRRILNAPLLVADWLFINSEFSLDTLSESWPRLRQKTTVVYNGVPGPDQALPPRRSIDHPRLLFLGRLSPRKGPQVVIEALADLPDTKLALLGDVFTGYEWFAEELRNRVTELGLSDRVEWLGFDGNIWPHLAAADIVLIPSVVPEPFGNTAVEAVLALRPVIVSDIGGLPEAVGTDEPLPTSVRLVPAGQVSAIVNAVKDLVENWDEVCAAVSGAKVRVDRRLAPPVYQRRMAELIIGGYRE